MKLVRRSRINKKVERKIRMGKVVKFLLPVFAVVVGVVGTAGATMAAETDYQKYYGEAMESLAGIDMSKALQLERKAVEEQFPEFDAYKDVPFGIKQIETLYPYDGGEGDHDIFGSWGCFSGEKCVDFVDSEC